MIIKEGAHGPIFINAARIDTCRRMDYGGIDTTPWLGITMDRQELLFELSSDANVARIIEAIEERNTWHLLNTVIKK